MLLWNVILEQHAALWTWWQWDEDAKRLFYDNDLCIQFPAGAIVVGPFSSVCQRCHAPVKFQTSSGHGQQLLELSLCHPSFYHPNLFCQWLDLSGSCLRSSQTLEGHPKLSAQEAWLPHHALDHPELQIQLEVQLQGLAPPAMLAETWAQVKRRNGKCEARAQVKQSAFKFFLQNLQSSQANPSYFFRLSHISWLRIARLQFHHSILWCCIVPYVIYSESYANVIRTLYHVRKILS